MQDLREKRDRQNHRFYVVPVSLALPIARTKNWQGFSSTLRKSEAIMTETCYSKGQKVILVTSQVKNGRWLCKFSIPGFSHVDGGLQGQDSSKGYKTEWEARTNAFQRAKLLLVGPQDMTQGDVLERT